MERIAGNILDQGTLCTEMMRLEVLRGQLVSQLSLKDAMAWQPDDPVLPRALAHLFSAHVECCRLLEG